MAKTIYTPDRQIQSARLIQAREAAGLTQKQVEEAVRISQSELSKIEKGQRKVESLTLRKLAELYHKPISFFLAPAESSSFEDGTVPYLLAEADEQEMISRQIRARRGNEKFRASLLDQYHNTCMISGCKIISLLEAAHIRPSRTPDDDHPANGLLLRSDIHTLFDLNLIGINPKTLTISVHKDIMTDGYEKFDGKKLIGCDEKGWFDAGALEYRWGLFLGES